MLVRKVRGEELVLFAFLRNKKRLDLGCSLLSWNYFYDVAALSLGACAEEPLLAVLGDVEVAVALTGAERIGGEVTLVAWLAQDAGTRGQGPFREAQEEEQGRKGF